MKWAPKLWREEVSSKEAKEMTMSAVRDFDSGKEYAKWKMGDKHSMVVRFVHHDRMELAG